MPTLTSMKRRLQGHVQQGGHVYEADLRSVQAFQSVWENVEFDHSRLSMGDFRGSKFTNCVFTKTTVYGSNWNAATLHGVSFDGCDAEQVSFVGAVLRKAVFTDCRLAYSSFAGATFHDVRFIRCNLHGCSLDMAEANDVSYLGSNLWSAVVPLGCAFFNSSFDADTANRFAAMLARVHPNESAKAALIGMAGETTYRAVCRLMQATDESGPEF